MFLELQLVTYILFFFGQCHVSFPYKEIPPASGHFHVTFPYVRAFFFGRFLQEVLVFYFQEWIARKTTQQSEGSCNAKNDSQLFVQKTVVLILQTPMKKLWVKNSFFFNHDGKMCYLRTCSYHILLIGDIIELLQKLDVSCFNYYQ